MILEKRIPISYLFKMIRWELLTITIFTLTLDKVSQYFQEITLNLSVPAFMGTAITLILSFKLSQSYDRWWEARKIWGAIVNDSRTWVVQLKSFLPKEHDSIKILSYRQIAWCYTVGHQLRKTEILEGEKALLDQEGRKHLKTAKHPALGLIDLQAKEISHLVRDGKINTFQEIALQDTLTRLCASMGKAERIKNTSFPKTYRWTMRFFIYLFLFLLGFSLTSMPYDLEIPLSVLISIPFFLLEQVAMDIQDPFENRPTDTPVSSIARTIEINIRELLGEVDLPDPIKPDKFYIM
jgi:putative membrane protein